MKLKIPSFIKLQQKYSYPFKYGIMDKLYKKKLSKKGISWVLLPNGYYWKLDLTLAVHRWMVYGIYDLPFITWVKKNLKSNSIIVDSGANIGQSTAYFSKIAKSGQVIACEPDDEAFDWLQKCIIKKYIENVDLINKGLGETAKEAFLEVPTNGRELGLHAFWSTITDSNHGKKINVTTLEQELFERDIKNVSLWKLDVEGYEINALQGALPLLENKQIEALYIELAIKE